MGLASSGVVLSPIPPLLELSPVGVSLVPNVGIGVVGGSGLLISVITQKKIVMFEGNITY